MTATADSENVPKDLFTALDEIDSGASSNDDFVE